MEKNKIKKFKLIILILIFITGFYLIFSYFNLRLRQSRATSLSASFYFLPNKFELPVGRVAVVDLLAQFQNGSTLEKIDYAKVVVNFPYDKLELVEEVDTSNSSLGRKIQVDDLEKANKNGRILIELGADKADSGPSTEKILKIATIKFRTKTAGEGKINLDSIFIVNNQSVEITSIRKEDLVFFVFEGCRNDLDCQTSATCKRSTCVCNKGYYNCDNNWENGCESQTACLTLNLKLKFQGVTSFPKAEKSAKLKIIIKGDKILSPVELESEVLVTENKNNPNEPFIWQGKVDLPDEIKEDDKYVFYIKGPKHLAKKICDNPPKELGEKYQCSENNKITLKKGENNLDFSQIYLYAGDLPIEGKQDGLVDSVDISFIRNNLGKKDVSILSVADLNFDGIVDTQDYSLVINALLLRKDEE